jgi:hypothetical protein
VVGWLVAVPPLACHTHGRQLVYVGLAEASMAGQCKNTINRTGRRVPRYAVALQAKGWLAGGPHQPPGLGSAQRPGC